VAQCSKLGQDQDSDMYIETHVGFLSVLLVDVKLTTLY